LPQRVCQRVLEQQRPWILGAALLRETLTWAWRAIRAQLS
jgi:hypothetical protein